MAVISRPTKHQPELLIACALKREARALRRSLSASVPVVWTGLGGRRTERRVTELLDETGARLLWFTGTCGGLDPQIEDKRVVLPNRWLLKNRESIENNSNLLRQVPPGMCARPEAGLTVNTPVLRGRTRTTLFQATGAAVCDMECFYALRAAAHCRVPGMAFKCVSDTANSSISDFWRNFDDCMASLAGFCNELLEFGVRAATPPL